MALPLEYYAGTKPGSPSGWQRRYTSEFTGATGKVYRVEIIDSEGGDGGFSFAHPTTGTQTKTAPILLGADGCTITYNGSADNTHDTFISSTLTMDVVIEGTWSRELWQKIKIQQEERFGVCLFRHEAGSGSSSSLTTSGNITGEWRLEWVGLLQPEGVEFVDHEVNELLRLKFDDGLARLNEKVFRSVNGTPLTGINHLGGIVTNCLARIPTYTIFGYSFGSLASDATLQDNSPVPFLEEEVYYYTDKHVTGAVQGSRSLLQNVAVEQGCFGEMERVEDALGGDFLRTEYVSCAEVLKNVLGAFRYRICMSNGRWVISNPSALTEPSYRHVYGHGAHVYTRPHDTTGTYYTQDDKAVTFARNSGHQYLPTKGFGTGFLYPIRSANSRHIKGGSSALLKGSQGSIDVPGFNGGADGVYRVPNAPYGPAPAELTNEAALIDGGASLFIRLNNMFTSIGWYYGQSNILDDAFRGCQVILQITLKVGDYYLKRDLVSSTDHIDIDIPGAGNNIEFKDWSQDGDVEWTLTPSTYDLACPFIGCDPEPPVVLQGVNNDIERVGGYHLKLENNGNEFRFKNGFVSNGTLQSNSKFDINWTPPPTPGGMIHEGLTFSAKAVYYDSDNNAMSSGQVNAGLSWAGLNQAMVWKDFGIYASDFEAEADVNFYAAVPYNSARIKCAESILGDKYAEASVNTLVHKDPTQAQGYNAPYSYCGLSWASRASGTPYRNLHKLNAEEAIRERKWPTQLFKGTVVTNVGEFARPPWNGNFTAANDFVPPIRPYNLINYDVREGNNIVEKFAYPLSLTWTVRSNSYEGVFALRAQDWTFSPVETDDKEDRLPINVGNGGGSPFTGTKGDHSWGSSGETSTDNSLGIKGIALTNETEVSRITGLGKPSTAQLLKLSPTGNIDAMPDGNAGEFLKTDGAGGFSFAPVSATGPDNVVVLTHTTTVQAIKGRQIYLGNRQGGWNASTWDFSISSSAPYSMAADAFIFGVPSPLTRATTLTIHGTVLAQNLRDSILVKVLYAPASTSSTLPIRASEAARGTVTIANTSDPVTFTFTASGLTVPAGSLIFAAFGRASSTNVTNANTLVTFTIVAS